MSIKDLKNIKELINAEKLPFEKILGVSYINNKTFLIKNDNTVDIAKKQLTEEEANEIITQMMDKHSNELDKSNPWVMVKTDSYRFSAIRPPLYSYLAFDLSFYHQAKNEYVQ